MWPRSKPRPCGWTARSDFFDGRRRAAGIIAVTALGIDQVEAEALPEQKSEIVKLRGAGPGCCLAGDGVEDAPALEAADVEIPMGSGTHVAIESAGVTLLTIWTASFFAFVCNAPGVPMRRVCCIRCSGHWCLSSPPQR